MKLEQGRECSKWLRDRWFLHVTLSTLILVCLGQEGILSSNIHSFFKYLVILLVSAMLGTKMLHEQIKDRCCFKELSLIGIDALQIIM